MMQVWRSNACLRGGDNLFKTTIYGSLAGDFFEAVDSC